MLQLFYPGFREGKNLEDFYNIFKSTSSFLFMAHQYSYMMAKLRWRPTKLISTFKNSHPMYVHVAKINYLTNVPILLIDE